MTNEAKPTLLQQGEYLPLPGGVFRIDPGSGGSIVGYSADQMHAYADATCAAQAAPAEIDAKSFRSYAETRAYSKGYYAGKKAAQAAPAPVAEDAANWHWLASYLVGPRTDLDDEIVASESVNALRKLVSAARAQAGQSEGGA